MLNKEKSRLLSGKKLLIILLIIQLLIINSNLYAQITFQKTYGGTEWEFCLYGQQTDDNGYILTGSTTGNGAGGYDVYLLKLNEYGDTLWTKAYGGSNSDQGQCVKQTFDDGYIITGSTSSFGSGRVYLIKTDSMGDTLWTRCYGGFEGDWAKEVEQTFDGGYIITGGTASFGVVNSAVYIIKTDAFGDILWTKVIGGIDNEWSESVKQTFDGGYIISGRTYGSGNGDFYLIRLDSIGDTLWIKAYGGNSADYSYHVEQTFDSGFIMVGHTWGFGAGSSDVYVVKTDSIGNLQWSKTYGGIDEDYGQSIQETNDSGFIITGYTKSFGVVGYIYPYLIRIDLNGDTLWTKIYSKLSGPSNFFAQQTSDNGYVILGSTATFGAGGNDCYIIKTDALGNVNCNTNSTNTIVTNPTTFLIDSSVAITSGGIVSNPATIISNTITFTNILCYDTGMVLCDTWTQKANFGGTARYGAVGFSIGSQGYIGTGSDGTYRNDFWEYDTTNNSWTQKADFAGTGRRYAVAFSIGNKGYIGTGYDGASKNDFWEYDPASNSWIQKADFGGTGRRYAVAFSIGNKGYIGTGYDGASKNDFWEYDTTSNSWTQKADFGGTARYGAVGFSIGSKGFIGTGNDGTGKDDFWEYDPTLNSWTQKADFGGTERSFAFGFSIGSKGYISTGHASYKNEFWEYDSTSNSWTKKTDFGGTARYGAVGFSIGSKGFIGTGKNGNYMDDFWEYTPESSITISITATDVTCNGGSDGTAIATLSGGSPPYSFNWSNGATAGNINGITAGYYSLTVTDSQGCSVIDSITINEPLPIITPDTATICSNDSIFLQGAYQNIPGTYYDTLLSVNNCDSIVITNLTVDPTYYINTSDVIICASDSALIFGVYQTIAGTYYDSLVTICGSDSVISTSLIVNPFYNIVTPDVNICVGDSALIFGIYKTIAGTYYDSLVTVCGSDSVISTSLIVNPVYTIDTLDVTICTGDSALILGIYQTTAGTYYDSLTTVNGCDSVIAITLIVNPTYFSNTPDETICDGDSVVIFGVYQTTAGTYYDSLTTVNGCDSITATTLIVNPTYNVSTSDETICNGDSALIFGFYQTTAGTYFDSLTTINGCDSIIATTLAVNPTPTVNIVGDSIVCGSTVLDEGMGMPGDTYLWSTGVTTQTIIVTTSGSYWLIVTDGNGCQGSDSINVIVNPTYFTNTTDVTICAGDSTLIFGVYQTTIGTYYDSLSTINGCDSIIATNLIVNATNSINTPDLNICDGDSTLIFGAYESTAGTYYDSLTTVNGCDSIISTGLIVNLTFSTNTPDETICDSDSVLIFGEYQSTAGTYFDSLTTVSNCDSIISTYLIVNSTYLTNTPDETICEGDSVLMFGVYRKTAGTYYDSLFSANGCDSVIATTLTVNPLPTVNFTGLDTSYCLNDTAVILTGTPSGGTFNGMGISGNQFDPSVAGIGTHIVIYSYTDGNSCSDSVSQNVIVNNCAGIENFDFINTINIYPNPNTGEFTLEMEIPKPQNLKLNIFNILGQTVYTETLNNIKGNYKKNIDLKPNPTGIYNLQILNDKNIINKKIIIR
ncbi:MAG: T9SS type A sorting domain-containing protein [Bacteroidota bacterium]